MANSKFNIAIDGPAGAGKSTIAKLVAKKLDFILWIPERCIVRLRIYMLKNGVDRAG